jgi:hypothetical protein
VVLRQLWPGIDMVLYGDRGQFEYDFLVAPGADSSRIAFDFSGADGLQLDADGNLVLSTTFGKLVHHTPVSFQGEPAERKVVESRFARRGARSIGFQVSGRDAAMPLRIDPKVSYISYFTTSASFAGWGGINALAVDSSGATYVVGGIDRDFLPSNGLGYQNVRNGLTDAFIAKLNAAGSDYLYTTYLGGAQNDIAYGVAVDTLGHAYVVGQTFSATNLPGLGAFPVAPVGGVTPYPRANFGAGDGFITKLSPNGATPIYSTPIGGINADGFSSVAVNNLGEAFVAGFAGAGFPFAGATFPPGVSGVNAGGEDAIALRINAAGTTPLWITYLGGGNADGARAIAIDGSNNAYIAGFTSAPAVPEFPASNARSGAKEGFVTKLAANGALVYSRFVGGTAEDDIFGIAVDANTSAFVTGYTASAAFISNPPAGFTFRGGASGYAINAPNRLQPPAPLPAADAFVVRLAPDGTLPNFGAGLYLGGTGFDIGFGIAIDANGTTHVGGTTFSNDFQTSFGARQFNRGSGDGFFTLITWSVFGPSVRYSSFFGGSGTDSLFAITADANGGTHIAGLGSVDLPATAGSAEPEAHAWNNPLQGFIAAFTPWLPTNPLFVQRIFQDILGRPATPDEVNFWASVLNNGAGRGDVANVLFLVPDFGNRGLYQLLLAYLIAHGRDADIQSFQFWEQMLQYGLVNIFSDPLYEAFVSGPEFIRRWGVLNNTQFIQRIYVNALGAPPDVTTQNNQVARLNAGTPRGTILRELILTNAQISARHNSRVFANLMILLLYRRTPDDPLVQSIVAQLNGGVPLPGILGYFVFSDEYLNRF